MSEQQWLQSIQWLAIGLLQREIRYNENVPDPITNLGSYLKNGWARLSYCCWQNGIFPPRTISELRVWLHQPLSKWKTIGDYFTNRGWDEALLIDGSPSALCENIGAEFAKTVDPQLELEDDYFRHVRKLCLERYTPRVYTELRVYIIRHPLIEDQFSLMANTNWHSELTQSLLNCYEAIPRRCIRNVGNKNFITLCPYCGWALEWFGDEAKCYRGGSCNQIHGDLSQSLEYVEYDINTPMMRTKPGIQRFIVAPEKQLVELADKLKNEWGLRIELFPNFDSYDLLIIFLRGTHWAIDMKDHRSARLLANHLKFIPHIPR